jgi:hypothetical protein
MDLLEIIITSLKIFALVAVIIISISYLFFRAKSRPKIFVTDEPAVTPIAQPSFEKVSPVITQKKYYEEAAPFAQRVMPVSRFKVLNNNSAYSKVQNGYRQQPEQTSKFSKRKDEEQTSFNIYNYYSDNEVAPMHKLKFSSMRNNNFS